MSKYYLQADITCRRRNHRLRGPRESEKHRVSVEEIIQTVGIVAGGLRTAGANIEDTAADLNERIQTMAMDINHKRIQRRMQ